MDSDYELDTPKGKNIVEREMYKGKRVELSTACGKGGCSAGEESILLVSALTMLQPSFNFLQLGVE